VHLRCEFDALPFASQSLDLVVLAHTLESARDPHLALREVERVLVPEGRVLIFGFNPLSLWRLKRPWPLAAARDGAHRTSHPRAAGEMIAYRRLRDWLRLLGHPRIKFRFDIAEVVLTEGELPHVHVIENAFQLPDSSMAGR
jgi:SAM-dependent methyltransferase